MENNKQITLIREQSFSLPDEANHIVILNDESLREANNFYQGCKVIIENIHKHMDPIRDSNYKAWKKSIDLINKLKELPLKAMETVKPKMIAYKLKVQAEIKKKEEEAQAKIDADKKKAEDLLEKAAEQETAGEAEKADETFEEAEAQEEKVKKETLKMKDIPKAPETKGVTMRKIPKWKLISLQDVPMDYMKLDEVKIGTVVRATKGEIKIPGIEVYFETV